MVAYDPAVHHNIGDIDVVDSAYAAATGADVLVVLTEWDAFRWVDMAKVAEVMATARIYDTRNIVNVAAAERAGVAIKVLGRS